MAQEQTTPNESAAQADNEPSKPVAKAAPASRKASPNPDAKAAPASRKASPNPDAKAVPASRKASPNPDAKAAPASRKVFSKPDAKAAEAVKSEKPKPEKAPEPVSRPAPPAPADKHYFWGTGRRKRAVARVRMKPGDGTINVNKKPLADYFDHDKDRQLIMQPLQATGMVKSWDIWVSVSGGGYTGQAGAVTLGIARAIAKAVPEVESALRANGLLTRDARMTERKKYGQKGARKRFQFSKR